MSKPEPAALSDAVRRHTPPSQLAELSGLRDQLKAGLSNAAQQPDKQDGPTISDLAEKIESLKAAHSFEAQPPRPRQIHASAEEPITARIRRRAEATGVSDQVFEPAAPAEPPQHRSAETPLTFRERIEADGQHRSPELSLP